MGIFYLHLTYDGFYGRIAAESLIAADHLKIETKFRDSI
jgi:hypothetical protein